MAGSGTETGPRVDSLKWDGTMPGYILARGPCIPGYKEEAFRRKKSTKHTWQQILAALDLEMAKSFKEGLELNKPVCYYDPALQPRGDILPKGLQGVPVTV